MLFSPAHAETRVVWRNAGKELINVLRQSEIRFSAGRARSPRLRSPSEDRTRKRLVMYQRDLITEEVSSPVAAAAHLPGLWSRRPCLGAMVPVV